MTPSRASKSRLAAVAQPGHLGDVDLDDRRQLGGDLQRLDHARGDDLAQPAHLLGGAALGRTTPGCSAAPPAAGAGVDAGDGAGARCGRAGCLGGVEDVLLADAAADTGALERAEVDAVLRRQLAHERGDVGRGVARAATVRAGGGRAGRAGADCGAVRTACGRGLLCRAVSCCAEVSAVAGAWPRGFSSCRDCSAACSCTAASSWRLVPAGSPSEAWVSAACCGACSCLLLGCRRGPAAGAADDGELGAHRHRLVLADEDLADGAGDRGGDLGVDLVGGDLEQRLVDLDLVALGLQPAGDGALGDRLAERGHRHGGPARGARRRCRQPGAAPAAAGADDAGADSGCCVLRGARLGRLLLLLLRRGVAGGTAAREPPPEPSPMTARSAPTGTVSSSPTRISCRVPATGDGISVSTLSVETSSNGSSTSTGVADALQPAGHGAFGDGLPKGRHGHAFRHVVRSPRRAG